MIIKKLGKIKHKFNRQIDTLLGSKNYGKFVIVTRSRTGSNFLVSLLNNHPNIHMEGEAFRRIGNHSCYEVWNRIFTPKLPSIKKVGFKIFYYHPIDTDDREVWDYLMHDKEIGIIHLRRQNMLRTLVSRKIADKTDIWSNNKVNSLPLSKRQISLSVDECISEFQKIMDWEQRTSEMFQDHPFLEITYERLMQQNNPLINDIFSFLHVPIVQVKSNLKRQNKESLKKLIVNYDNIYDNLKNTAYAYMLDENNNQI